MKVAAGTAAALAFREISIQKMLSIVREIFGAIQDWRQNGEKICISLCDALMSALAVFGLKCSSLLQFEGAMGLPATASNIRKLYLVEDIPSDTCMREIIDEVDPKVFNKVFAALFEFARRHHVIDGFKIPDGTVLISIDGTGYFSSKKVHCKNCCMKVSSDGTVTYYHQMLTAVVINPSKREVIAIAAEPIIKQDGATKNDCERNAAKRLLQALRLDHPHLAITIVEDGLSSNAPHIEVLKSVNMSFILGCKEDDHTILFQTINDLEDLGGVDHLEVIEGDLKRTYRWTNDVSLNGSNENCAINFLEYWEENAKNGKKLHFSWVTDKILSKDNIETIMKNGRARWHIENETFNTLKNQGYNFEHNYGHGHKNLSVNMAMSMLVAFTIDELQKVACPVFKKIRSLALATTHIWSDIRSFFTLEIFANWLALYRRLIESRLPASVRRAEWRPMRRVKNTS